MQRIILIGRYKNGKNSSGEIGKKIVEGWKKVLLSLIVIN